MFGTRASAVARFGIESLFQRNVQGPRCLSNCTNHFNVRASSRHLQSENLGSIPRLVHSPVASGCEAAPFNVQFRRNFRSSRPSSAPKKDAYEILGVSKSASQSELKKAYFQLAKKWHPDVNKGKEDTAEKFAEINSAYELLKDEEKRKIYDSYGYQGVEAADAGVNPGANPFTQDLGGFTAEEMFADFASIFGRQQRGGFGGPRPPVAERGADLQASLRISFMEAVRGTKRDLSLDGLVSCNTCNGSGARPGTSPTKCPKCKGQGVETQQVQGMFLIQTACSRCSGEGTVITEPCRTCNGEGSVRARRSIQIDIPAGVDTGVNLRLSGKGDPGQRGGPNGDLFVKLTVDSDPIFRRQGADVYVNLPVSITQAILGATLKSPSLAGDVDVKVPAGTQPGDSVTLRAKGIRRLDGKGNGDQYIIFKVEIPRNPTAHQRKLIAEFAKEEESTSSSKQERKSTT